MSGACFIPNVAAAAGPSLVGYMLNWGLYGILTIQVYIYILAFSNDRLFIRCVVYAIYTLETVQTVLLTQNAFRVFGSGFGNPSELNSVGISWIAVGIMGALSACIVQMFYAYRISVISKTKLIPAITSSLALISTASAIVSGVMSHRGNYYAIWISTGIWDGSAVACDMLIAVSVTFYLKKHAKNTHVADTEVLVERVIQLSIETGTLTAIMSVLTLSLTFLPSHVAYYQTPILALAKLYATTLMVHLNSRMQVSSTAESRAWSQSNRARTASTFDTGGVRCTVRTVQLVDSVGSASDKRRRTSEMSRTAGGTSDAGFEIEIKGEKEAENQELYRMGSPAIA
ncbi:hypothetical protein HYPSUDRAFT_161593 [Hypholoma sublateritium FD-334 SS-4]|uniref:DUF6534 domain-containing protein n=1 Tax=Hypholoma sublateritium (strain FD-334 SS-4) TaxID=945553 RepID=A0A0D2LBX6_HYPSF|nr:hypothetical protein HYPSUDRAFT_161593 [Hypholoma sublateritium FD-334 SS-4]